MGKYPQLQVTESTENQKDKILSVLVLDIVLKFRSMEFHQY